MSAMHPESGVPPEDARNSIPNDIEASVNCDELWYSTSRCQPRFDPAAANAMLAELINLINKGEVIYDCNRYDQVQFAVRYLIQRGLCTGTFARSGPNQYVADMDPPCTRYNDFLTIIVVPEQDNAGPVQLDLNARGYRDVVRNDGKPLEKGDWLLGEPLLISFWNGVWHMVGLVASQVPCVLDGTLIRWIRTDGDDVNGDGSENTPEKAFRTIQAAWNATASGCASSPGATIVLQLGIPGTYVGAQLGPFGGSVYMLGDSNNIAGYRISNFGIAPLHCFAIGGIPICVIRGVTMLREGRGVTQCIRGSGYSGVIIHNVAFDSTGGGVADSFIFMDGGRLSTLGGDYPFYGRGLPIGSLIATEYSGTFQGYGASGAVYRFIDCPVAVASFYSGILSSQLFQGCTVVSSGVTGRQYWVTKNSVLQMVGQTPPGTSAGTVDTGGQYIP